MQQLPFIDAHAHLWDLARLDYAWLSPPFADDGPNGDVSAIANTYLLDDYRREAAAWNVVGMVHVEAGAAASQAVAETDWLQAMADERDMPSGVVAFAALDDPALSDVLAAHAARPAVRGIRHIVNWHANPKRSYTARDHTQDEAWKAGFAQLADHGLSFDLQAYPDQFAGLADLFDRHPEIPIIVNHTGMGIDDEGEWRAALAHLAALPHVSIKISGMGFVFRPLAPALVRARILATIDLFGTDRAMFASDMPTDRLFGSFDETMGHFADAVADFTEGERHALFARNANRIYRLDLTV